MNVHVLFKITLVAIYTTGKSLKSFLISHHCVHLLFHSFNKLFSITAKVDFINSRNLHKTATLSRILCAKFHFNLYRFRRCYFSTGTATTCRNYIALRLNRFNICDSNSDSCSACTEGTLRRIWHEIKAHTLVSEI